MREEPFDWTRWDRANEHRQSMAGVWNDYITDHPFDFSLDHRGGGEFILQVRQERPTPPELAVLCGEWLYNLRGCLDYVIWSTAAYQHGTIPPPSEGILQYPIIRIVLHGIETSTDWGLLLHTIGRCC